jgi:hypothetical protein
VPLLSGLFSIFSIFSFFLLRKKKGSPLDESAGLPKEEKGETELLKEQGYV